MKFILAKKIEMTQIFDEERVIPVTVIEAGPCEVKQRISPERVQISFANRCKEFVNEELKKGDKVEASIFEAGDKVTVSGISKGKGYQGAVKKWGFAGQSASHGVKHTERTIGSVGSRFPQKTKPGKKMPGRMGSERITQKNMVVVKVEGNRIFLKGAVPGRRGTVLEIKQ
jgi:large subunit ribosomal protein L3